MSNCHIINTGVFRILSKLTSLQQLNLYWTQIGNGKLSLYCTELKILDLWRCHSITAKGTLQLCNLIQLTDLDLGWCNNVLAMTECIQTLISSCNQLRRLLLSAILSAHRQTSDLDIQAVSQHLGSRLKQFSCMGSRNVTTESNLAVQCYNLKLFDVIYCENLQLFTLNCAQCYQCAMWFWH